MADDEQFSLCWNNFNTNLSAGFHESLVRGDLVDVTLAAEGQLVKAHRLILSVCSPYFRKMFTQMPANQHAFIFLKDVSHSALKDLIQFMYCGEVNVKQDALPAFISTAEALQIKGLTETGESAPAHQSPAKEPSHVPSASSTTIPSVASSPRAKPVPRSRIQSYKLDSDDGSDHEKVVQIQATSTPASVASASSSTVMAAQVSTPQQVQILQQQPQSQKRTLQQRASITPQTTQIMKRAKLTDPLEASEPTQIQTVQIVKQITQTPQPTVSTEPEYVEMPIETINPKAEPEYADDPSEVEAIETEHEQEQSLAEQDTAEHDQEDDSAHYVEDETYGDMSKYDETYFAEGDDAKAGASGFGSESYAESGTGADQAAQDFEAYFDSLEPIMAKKTIITLDDQELDFVPGQRGTSLLRINGYCYAKNNKAHNKTYWVCRTRMQHRACNARAVTTLKSNGLYRIIVTNPVHIHEPTNRWYTPKTYQRKPKSLQPPPSLLEEIYTINILHPLIEFALSATPSPVPPHWSSSPPLPGTSCRSSRSRRRQHKAKHHVLDDQSLVLYESQRGKFLLVLDDYTFSKNNTVGDTTYWACRVVTNHVKCKARASTTRKLNGMYRIMLGNAAHNHPPKVSRKLLVQSGTDPNVYHMNKFND